MQSPPAGPTRAPRTYPPQRDGRRQPSPVSAQRHHRDPPPRRRQPPPAQRPAMADPNNPRPARPLRWYHILITVLVLLSGLACISFGVFLIFRDPLSAFNFDKSGETSLQLFFSITYLSLAAGVLLCFVALCGALSNRGNRCIVSLYIAILVIIIVLLIATCFASFVIMRWTRTKPDSVITILRESWVSSVEKNADDVCSIQARYNCYGFDDDVCIGCWEQQASGTSACGKNQTEQCPYCPNTRPSISVGCFSAFVDVARPLYLTLGSAAAVVATLLIVDIPVVLCL